MSKKKEITHVTAVIEEQKEKAIKLDYRIKSNGQIMVQAMVEFCKTLKEMRDSALYKELGYKTFDSYIETELKIKYRQAYNYIHVYEKLKPELLESGLGIKKLELLTQIPDLDRESFIKETDLDNLTTAELQEKIKVLYSSNEQLTLELEVAKETSVTDDTLEKKLEIAERAKDEAEKARLTAEEKLSELENNRQQDIAQPVEVDIEAIRQSIVKEEQAKAEKEIKEAAKLAKADAKKDVQKEIEKASEQKIEEARKVAFAEGQKLAEQDLKKLKIEQDAATKRAAELEKQLQLASSAESTKFSIYFANLEAQYQQMNSLAEEMKTEGKAEEAEKLLSALEKGLQMMIDNLKK